MKSKTTTIFEESKKTIPFRISHKFDMLSIIHKGKHYFPYDKDIQRNIIWRGEKRNAIQVVFNDNGKWRQDTMYITDELLDQIIEYAKKKNIV